ncbi:MAG: N-acetylmuramoyl-L-alanine amidase [Hyphomicrobiaceae bacterium]
MSMTIDGDRLVVGGAPAAFTPARVSGGRMAPELIVLHETAGRLTPGSSVDWFTDPACKVSAHIVIERDGSITQCVPFDMKAWHCDPSEWRGRPHVNHFSIGVEIVGPGRLTRKGDELRAWFGKIEPDADVREGSSPVHQQGLWLAYTAAQIDAVVSLCLALKAAYPGIQEVTTHAAICKPRFRKEDVNPLFPLSDVQRRISEGLGRAPQPVVGGLTIGARGASVEAAQQRLAELGYQVGSRKPDGRFDGVFGPQTRVAVLAFEAENKLETDGVLSLADRELLESDTAKAMPVGARAVATADDLAAKGSAEVGNSRKIKRAVETAAGALVTEATVESSTGVSIFDTVGGTAGRLAEQLGKVSSLASGLQAKHVVLAGGILVCVMLWRWADRIEWLRVLRHRLGLDLGR